MTRFIKAGINYSMADGTLLMQSVEPPQQLDSVQVQKKLAKPPKRDDLRSDDDDNYSVASSVISNTDTSAEKGGTAVAKLGASHTASLSTLTSSYSNDIRSIRDKLLDKMSACDYYDDVYKSYEFQLKAVIDAPKFSRDAQNAQNIIDDGLWTLPVRPPLPPSDSTQPANRRRTGGAVSGDILRIFLHTSSNGISCRWLQLKLFQ